MAGKKKRNLAKDVVPDLILVGLIVMIVVMLITPLSPAMIDILVFTSLTLSILTLMLSIYVEDAVAFSTYPVVLLIMAIWRISLSVATTRNILVDGDAGEIIRAFGEVAISGNIIVGVVIFFLITIVQFIVINKGSERVAEVGARFTLDSLPGKQMSIDADVRAGSIDTARAQQLRNHLQAESQFHGAMDGAMKFLKGDAIAGLLMVFVNFLGGMLIGMTSGGLTFQGVIEKYTILSIGDALIGQVPAIFTAVSAGILVTRVSTGENDSDSSPTLSSEVIGQFLRYSRAFLASAGVITVIAFIPGFPTLLCLSFAVLCGVGYWLIDREDKRRHRGYESGRPGGDAPARIHVLLGATIGSDLSIPNAEIALRQRVRDLTADAGVECPACEIHIDTTVGPNVFILVIDDTPIVGGEIDAKMAYATNCATVLKICGIESQLRERERPGLSYFAIAPEHRELVTSFGVRVLDAQDYLVERVLNAISLSLVRLLDIDQVRKQLIQLAKQSPDVHRELFKLLPPAPMTDLLRKLVAEQVPTRNMTQIFERLLLIMQHEKDPHSILRALRQDLVDVISFKWICSDGRMYAIQLSDQLQESLSQSMRTTSDGDSLEVDFETAQLIASEITDALESWELEPGKLVLLTPADLRYALFRLMGLSFPGLPFIAYEEVRRDVEVQPFRVIGGVAAETGADA